MIFKIYFIDIQQMGVMALFWVLLHFYFFQFTFFIIFQRGCLVLCPFRNFPLLFCCSPGERPLEDQRRGWSQFHPDFGSCEPCFRERPSRTWRCRFSPRRSRSTSRARRSLPPFRSWRRQAVIFIRQFCKKNKNFEEHDWKVYCFCICKFYKAFLWKRRATQ